MGSTKIERAALALSVSGVGVALRRLPVWSGLLVLCYHRVGSAGSSVWEPSLWDVTVDQLDRQLTFLARNADIVAPADLLAADGIGRGRHVMLTFDDGYREWATDVLPVLGAHDVSAAFFLATGFLDDPRAPWWFELPWMVRSSERDELPAGGWLAEPLRFDQPRRHAAVDTLLDVYKTLPTARTGAFLDWVATETGSGRCDPALARHDWLDWDGARALRDAGMEIGGHTVDHPVLARTSPRDQREQIDACARRLAEELERPMRMFSYPVGLAGSFDAHTRAALEAAGVEVAFSYDGGFVATGAPFDRLDVPRVTGGMDPQVFRAAVAMPQLFARW